MTLPALAAALFRLASAATPLQNGTVLDIAPLLPTFELRVAASILVTIAVVAAWRLGARLHDKELEAVSMPVWRPSVTVLRLVAAAGGGEFVFVLWSLSGDISTISAQYDLGRETFVRIALSAAFVIGAYVLTSVLGRFIDEIANTRPEISGHQREIIYRITQMTTCLTTLAVILGIWRVDLGGFLIGAGLLGVMVGMVARQTLGLLIAGSVIMFSRPFKIGDWAKVDDHEGIVAEITVVNTCIQAFDGEFVVIPSDVVSSESLVNRSRKGRLRLDIEVGVDYDADIDRATEVAQAIVKGLDKVLLVPKPQVVTKRFGDSAVVLGVHPWIDRPSARRWWRARTATILAVNEAFDEEGITTPFSQRVLSECDPSGPISLTDQRPEASPEVDGGVEGGDE